MKRRREDDDLSGGCSSADAAGCSNTTLDDGICADVLDLLDIEAAGPSNDGDDGSDPVLEPKHDIFLSHSGKQKDFTELLCRELERWGYNPFFDIRDDSLPKGKKFPELIFRAAGQCRVAILILSEAFFTNTKWPMLELAAFVDAQRNPKKSSELHILPVYFELTRVECKNDENRRRWQKTWEEMEQLEVAERMKEMRESEKVELEAEIEVARKNGLSRAQKWKDAVKVLGPSNGIEYERSSRHAGLIDGVVRAVRGLLPPPNMASDASVQGRKRICETIIQKIAQTTWRGDGVRVVGMYGVGGIGKTTFCKELCYELYKRFEGRVCRVEFESKSEKELRKEVVRKLTNINPDSLSLVEDSKVSEHLKKGMAGERVFLAVDNVWQESVSEAMFYIHEARYGRGSIVLVTARSIEILKRAVGIGEDMCFEMPEVEKEDARKLFLHYAAPGCEFGRLTHEDEENIEYCVKLCLFSKGENKGVHFHPLALKVLGSQLQGSECNPRKWVESVSEGNNFNHDRRKEHPIFHILGRGYDLLREDDKLLFMDAVVFSPRWTLSKSRMSIYERLSIVHYTDESSIRKRLQGLKARGLLEGIGEGLEGVIVHDLYREFAKFEANRGNLSDRCSVWHEGIRSLPTDLLKMPPGGCWSNVEGVGVCSSGLYDLVEKPGGLTLDGIEWQHFGNVVVLALWVGEHEVLNLSGLRRLRSLTLYAGEAD